MSNNSYCVDYAKRGTAGCKECKEKIEKGCCRIGKLIPNWFTDKEGAMKQWYHIQCIFKQLSRARATTKKIENPSDLEGWEELQENDKDEILKYIQTSPSSSKKMKATVQASNVINVNEKSTVSKGNSFKDFRRLCANIAEESSYNKKTELISEFFNSDSNRDIFLWAKLLLPGVNKRIYNLQSKMLIKLFSQIFGANQAEMLEDLEQGDIAETVRIFFEESTNYPPVRKSNLTLKEVDMYLDELSNVTKEEEQNLILQKIARRCTGNDLKMVVRLISHDLRINAGPKHILEAIHPTAYKAFQKSHDLKGIVDHIKQDKLSCDSTLLIGLRLLTPIKPMLAEPCRSVQYAFKKCVNGIYSEIKYDGERVQVHKKGDTFSYFSRSLKPVLPHKVAHFKEHIAKAFEFGKDLIIDSEILLLDTNTNKPLPFGTLGKHKKAVFKDATVCLFVFDCIYFNGTDLMNFPLKKRRSILEENMKEVKNHIKFSEMKLITNTKELEVMISSVLKQGLEGLVLKDAMSKYEPGKRHWLKVKKDYLQEGAMADTADLVVLGAYFGTGNKGGMKSIFLMGCFDTKSRKWCTVTKVHGGHTDEVLDKLQTELDMVKINQELANVPDWLKIKKSLVPDFVCRDPKRSQVWEITGAEFSHAESHTAGISIRFPRVTRIRDDKTSDQATTLQELEKLYAISKETIDLSIECESDKAQNLTDKYKVEKRKASNRSSSPSSELPSKKVLVDVFTGVRLYLPLDTNNYDTLKRYFIAYNGELLQKHEVEKSTHILNTVSIKHPSENSCIICIDWLWDCIKLQKLLSVDIYRPNNDANT